MLRLAAPALLLGGSLAHAGCRPPTVVTTASPSSPGASVYALVLGRVQVSIAGQPARVGPQAWRSARAYADGITVEAEEDALTALIFEGSRGGDRFAYEIEDETGRIEVLLPPGRYRVTLRYDKWWSKTPATLDVPEGGVSYYVGTLYVGLFRERSLRGVWVRAVGGTVPRADTSFAIADEWDWAQANLRGLAGGRATPDKRLMRLEEDS
jgi:hypothetical protein